MRTKRLFCRCPRVAKEGVVCVRFEALGAAGSTPSGAVLRFAWSFPVQGDQCVAYVGNRKRYVTILARSEPFGVDLASPGRHEEEGQESSGFDGRFPSVGVSDIRSA
jgi:hypothetical protein